MAGDSTYDRYYVPEQSRLPIFASLGLGAMMYGLACVLGSGTNGLIMYIGMSILFVTLFFWFSTVIKENHAGINSDQLKNSYVWGMSWFIFSEVMFFAAFFGALYYVRNLAVPWLDTRPGNDLLWPNFTDVWPVMNNPDPSTFTNPQENMELKGFSYLAHYLPFWNTVILVSSSFTVHFAHTALKNNERNKLTRWLGITVVLGILFIALQGLEYHEAYEEMGLTLNSGIYGSTFFLLTGFHGFHVTLGTFILSMVFIRTLKGHFKPDDHFGFEAASWYWHFVDVVWVMLFFFVYII